MGYSLKPRGSSRWVSAAIVVPLPEASQPSKTMRVGTAVVPARFLQVVQTQLQAWNNALVFFPGELLLQVDVFEHRLKINSTQFCNAFAPSIAEPHNNDGWWQSFSGTGLVLAAIVGSGIMGERLASGNVAIALLAITIATGAALVTLILALGRMSGAHFNPAVTMADAWQYGISRRDVPAYLTAQIAGAFVCA